MFFTKLFNFFSGYLKIRIIGRYPERLLNLLKKNGIFVWNCSRCGEAVLVCKVKRRDFVKMRALVKKTDCKVKIISRHGFWETILKYKKRKWFLLGAGIFAVIIFLFNCFIWDIEIVGNEKVNKSLIIENLKECGLKKGAYKARLDEKEIKNQMLIKMPELSWIWPDISGSKAVVSVREKTKEPEIFDAEKYKNIIAGKDGVIESMIVKSGTPMVKIGDTVIKGDVLISGVLESQKELMPRYVQSEGEVFAKVWYEKSKAVSRDYIIKRETGRRETKRILKIGPLKIKLFLNENTTFLKYMTQEKQTQFTIFGIPTGITVFYKEYTEITQESQKQSLKSVIADGFVQLTAEIEKETSPNSKLCSIEQSEEIIDEDTAIVTIKAMYLENIAEKIDAKRMDDQ